MRTRTGTVGQLPRKSVLTPPPSASARSKSSGRRARLVERPHRLDPAHPERAQRARAPGERDEVPDPCLQHEAERIEQPLHLAVALAVADLDPLLLPHGSGQRGEVGDRLLAGEPARRVEVEPLAHPHGPAAQLRRQGGVDLELGGGEHRAEPELGGRARGGPESASASASSAVRPVRRVR